MSAFCAIIVLASALLVYSAPFLSPRSVVIVAVAAVTVAVSAVAGTTTQPARQMQRCAPGRFKFSLRTAVVRVKVKLVDWLQTVFRRAALWLTIPEQSLVGSAIYVCTLHPRSVC
mmetsp:Transcript_3559/g.6742  ORF Transcript_3559/g.6742 Transcript_3559/m.6742 type:complete len:115 (-) Transcript_3559:679-1023(-)